MKSLLASERSKAILDIDLTAIGIGAISNKVISYPIQMGAVSKVLKN